MFVTGLDVSKAFDSVNYCGICFIKLVDANSPVRVLNTFYDLVFKITWLY